ncbi:TT1751-like protein [Favolaschia claudopus]|uniref:TT1751-like protein n=1 Tax=Favolaschia claudopus TaxID=2862362 RepID=A0AAW0EDU7_9AGAR
MAKTVTLHTLQIVTFSTTLSFAEVISRLDNQIGKETTRGIPVSVTRAVTSKEDLEAQVNNFVGPSGFGYFNEFNHGRWLQLYSVSTQAVVYVVGNPLIAQSMLQHDLHGALNIPPRLLVLEKQDSAGTEVIYHLPSSVIALNDDPKLKAAAEGLDSKLQALVESITAVES